MRYVIFEDSLTGHCCFEYSIVDTTQGDNVDVRFHKGLNIAEVFYEDKAIEICKALNFVEHGYKCYTTYHNYEWVKNEKGHCDRKEWKVKEALIYDSNGSFVKYHPETKLGYTPFVSKE